jgi:hypothetical protein
MPQLSTKKVVLSQIIEDLESGLTRWKKDDIGFGSLEKKYSLTLPEMIKLLAHPKINLIETTIPAFVIVDDLEEVEELVQTQIESVTEQIKETKIEVAVPVIKEKPAYRKIEQPEEELIEAFI